MVLAEFNGQSLSQVHIYGNNAIDLSSSSLGQLNIFHAETDGYYHLPPNPNGGFLKGTSAGNYSWETPDSYGSWVISENGIGGFDVDSGAIVHLNAGDNISLGLSGGPGSLVTADIAVSGCVNDTPYVVQDYINFPYSGGNYQMPYSDLPFYEQNAIDTMLGYKQDTIRACADGDANNNEIFISTSVTNLRLSFKDMAGVVTRTT